MNSLNPNQELIGNLRSLANLLDKRPTLTEEILSYAYDVLELTEVLINDTVGYN